MAGILFWSSMAAIWIIGLIGIFRTSSIKKNYGDVISGGWAFARLVRACLNISMATVVTGNMAYRLQGGNAPINWGNVIGCIAIIAFNFFVRNADKKRFYDRCDRQLAHKIISAERQIGYSMVPRLSLIFTAFSFSTLFAMTDTSEYVRDNEGNIYRIRD